MECTNPRTVCNPKTGRWIEVPCGMCMACRLSKSREWSIRLKDELATWKAASFVTLTYDDAHVPTLPCSHFTLVKSDLQKFFKRLRKDLDSETKIKYYACGEYGDTFKRPHYHCIIFGLGPSDLPLIQQNWPYGFVKIGTVTQDSINYVTGYVRKKYNHERAWQEYGFCALPPFQVCSQGLGLNFLRNNREEFETRKYSIYKNAKVSLPRYYLKKEPNLKLLVANARYYGLQAQNEKFQELSPSEQYRRLNGTYDSDKQRDFDLKAKAKLKERKF